MATALRSTALTVRQLPASTAARLRRRAKANQRSLEAEVRDILIRAAEQPTVQEWLAEAERLRSEVTPWQPGMPTAADLVRDGRDEDR